MHAAERDDVLRPIWYVQQLGAQGAGDTIRHFMRDSVPVMMSMGSGILAVLAQSFTGAASAGVFVAMVGFWWCWMLLGILGSLHKGERFEMSKVMGGGIHFAAALVIWSMGVVADFAFMSGRPVASLAFGGFMAGAFLLKAVAKGTYFFPGLRNVAERVLPGLVEDVGHREDHRRGAGQSREEDPLTQGED